MIRSDDFWGSNHYDNPPLTTAAVRAAERELGVTLPDAFVALLRIQNGGYTRGFAFPMTRRTSGAEDHVPLNELAGIVTDADHVSVHNVLVTGYMTREWGLPPRQVLLTGEGHWWITLDYRAGGEPAVTWLDVESGEDFQVAPSFDAFLDGLVPASDFDQDDDAEAGEASSVVWRPDRIRFSIEEPSDSNPLGRKLRLDQVLDENEKGWTMTRLDLPKRWQVAKLELDAGDVRLTLTDGRTFAINGTNLGPLGSALMSFPRKSDEALEPLWHEHAGHSSSSEPPE